jgi:hypothetical protein
MFPGQRVLCVLLLLLPMKTATAAQFGSTPLDQVEGPPPGINTHHQILVSGCVKRSNDGGYLLTDQNGKTWELTAGKYNLAEQVSHSVRVAGKEFGDTRPKGSSGNLTPGLRVVDLKVLSPSCTR